MTVITAATLPTVSEDELDEMNDPSSVKPKSAKKKKKKDYARDDEDETTLNGKSKKKKKKKKASSSEEEDDDDDDDNNNNVNLTGNTKPKSIKKKKTSVGTETTAAPSDDDNEKPKSKRTITEKCAPGRGTIPGRGGRAEAGRGRSHVNSGRSYRTNNGTSGGMNVSGHHPQSRAPMRPNSMSVGGRGNNGSLSSNSAHNPSMCAPGRPSIMAHPNQDVRGGRSGRGGRGLGRNGNSMRNSLHGGSTHGAGGGLGNGSHHVGRPASILRSSTHGRGRGAGAVIVGPDGSIRHLEHRTSTNNLGNGSTHRGMGSSGRNFQSNFVPKHAPPMERSNSVDSFDIDNDDIEGDFPEKNGGESPVVTGIPGIVDNLSKSLRNMMDMSVHSGLGAGGDASQKPSADRRSNMKHGLSQFNFSTRSMLTVDYDDSGDNCCVRCLRSTRLMAPYPNENPLKKRVRIVTWTSLVLDLLAAIVAITTYDGVTTCCGQPIMDIAGNFPWEKIITAVTFLYIFLIFLEVIPVVREGFPFNLMNPFIGFLITFAVFFDDSIVEAASMWVIEALAVACETYVFRMHSILYKQRVERLEKIEDAINTLRSTKRKIKQLYQSGKSLNVSNHSMGSVSYDDGSNDSFLDEADTTDDMTTGGKSIGTDISKVRENKLYRERRMLRESNAIDRRKLRYHLIGVCVNIFLVGLSLLIICVISKNRGLCIIDMEAPNVFKNDQLQRCYGCQGSVGTCEICHLNGTSQCYYPYG
ncbi:hypothetical protein IV203_025460 [Nitzschia inconspicua]|uniref:Uncharacterized protein n=1 Tax=Nitzschia inconspicua TaxID=303405 RepID=A0A9K3KAZ5_9STRA|nr:hypothetical protein IV203_028242 [Nitzschia inconspicua]KAG7362576.1 hypothetical protein IV203_025460 [Nitzschia inconspicua]